MSLLQDVLRSHTLTQAHTSELESRLNNISVSRSNVLSGNVDTGDSDDDTLVNVVSLPGTPSRTRPPSPSKIGASMRPAPGPLHIKSLKTTNSRDPLKLFPTEVSQRIFGRLGIRDLSKCALVCRKWSRSQSVNYVWFQHYRMDNFQDSSLPTGKWTKRESKQNWRTTYLQSTHARRQEESGGIYSGYSTPLSSGGGSGYQTPREVKEEKWRSEAESSKVGKVEMRTMYKELGGRKSRAKTKLGSSGVRDKGGWGDGDADY